ncbi:MAG: multidrug ABC transporter substrate-binding protein, partial [Methanospirillum sp.]|nr:multidrug ABC transporter substrate-binding protein [Methanospirillum sp.]
MCYAIIAASLFSGNYLLLGAADSVQNGISRLGADLVVVPADYAEKGEAVLLRGEPTTFFFGRNILPDVEDISGVSAAAPQLYIATLDTACCYLPVQLITFDSERDFTIIPWLREHDHPLLKKDEIMVGNLIVPDVGTSLKFYGHEFIISGKLDPTGTGLDTSIFIRKEDAAVMAKESKEKAVKELVLPESGVSAVLVKVQNVSEINRIRDQISARIPGVKVLTPETLITRVTGQLNTLTKILAMTALVAILVSVP